MATKLPQPKYEIGDVVKYGTKLPQYGRIEQIRIQCDGNPSTPAVYYFLGDDWRAEDLVLALMREVVPK